MKFLSVTFALLACTSAGQAEDLSPCHVRCFEKKTSCNLEKSHTFNTCHEELFACKGSCESGKPQEAYRTSPSFEIALNPIVDLELKS